MPLIHFSHFSDAYNRQYKSFEALKPLEAAEPRKKKSRRGKSSNRSKSTQIASPPLSFTTRDLGNQTPAALPLINARRGTRNHPSLVGRNRRSGGHRSSLPLDRSWDVPLSSRVAEFLLLRCQRGRGGFRRGPVRRNLTHRRGLRVHLKTR